MRDDVRLLNDWAGGDRGAGDELFDRHFDAVARFFSNKVNRGSDDLIQKTFLACIEGRDRLKDARGFRAFLFGIARNVLFRHYREQRRDAGTFAALETSVFDLDPSPSAIAAQHQRERVLLDALRRIPVDLQIALELHYWEELTVAEIADVLAIPKGTASSRLRRGRELLVHKFDKLIRGPAPGPEIDQLDEWARSLRELLDRSE